MIRKEKGGREAYDAASDDQDGDVLLGRHKTNLCRSYYVEKGGARKWKESRRLIKSCGLAQCQNGMTSKETSSELNPTTRMLKRATTRKRLGHGSQWTRESICAETSKERNIKSQALIFYHVHDTISRHRIRTDTRPQRLFLSAQCNPPMMGKPAASDSELCRCESRRCL